MLHARRGRRSAATLVAVATAFALVSVGLVGPSTAAPRSGGKAAAVKTVKTDLIKIKPAKVRGTYTNPDTGRTGRVIARFAPTEFVNDDGALAVEGTLKGVLTGKAAKGKKRQFTRTVVMPVMGAGNGTAPAAYQPAAFTPAAVGDCDILSLNLGPLDLNILGLQIDLAEVVLDIVAQPGAGNLLGNLLCAVAGLLDGGLGGLLDGVVGLLNDLIGGLTGITGLLSQLEELLSGLGGLGAARTV